LVSKTGHAAIGTDFDGFVAQPGPRFGPFACLGRNKGIGNGDVDEQRLRDPDTGYRWPSAKAATRSEVEAQENGVAYTTVPDWNMYLRFANDGANWPYDYEEVAMWEALVTWRAGKPPESISTRYGLASTQARWRDTPVNFVKGLYATRLEGDFYGNGYITERNAAYLAKTGAPIPANISPAATAEMARKLRKVYLRWEAMQRSPNAAQPLVRSRAGVREFDVNIDGLAHYGMLPDFLQDVANLLRTSGGQVRDLGALFRSVDDYVRMWEKVEAGKGR
jgi:hypothetical protein